MRKSSYRSRRASHRGHPSEAGSLQTKGEHPPDFTLFDALNDAVICLGLDGRIRDVNDAALEAYGYTRAELLAMSFADLHAPGQTPVSRIQLDRCFNERCVFEVVHQRKDGSTVPLEISLKGQVVGGEKALICLGRDITRRKAIEEELRRRGKDFHAIVDRNADAMIVLDRDGRIRYVNPSAQRLFSLPESELIGQMFGFPLILHEPVSMYVLRGFRQFVAVEMRMVEVEWQGRPSFLISFSDITWRAGYEDELRQRHEKMEALVQERAQELLTANEQLQAEISAVKRAGGLLRVEIEERKSTEAALLGEIRRRERSETALRESEEKYRVLTQTTSAAICILQDGHFKHFNPAMEAISGYTGDELTTIDFLGLIHPDSSEHVAGLYSDWQKGITRGADLTLKGVRKNGEERWLDVGVNTINYNGRPALILTAIDITERKRAEDALRKSEEKYRELVENANSIIIRWDPAGRVTFFNEFAERFFGYPQEEIIGRDLVGTIVPRTDTSGRDLAAMIEDITRYPERYSTNVNENVRRDGERVWMSWTNRAILDRDGNLVEVLSVGNDIAAHKRAEDALRKSEANMLKAQQMARLGNWELDLRSNEMSGSDETFRMFEIDPKATHSFEAFMNRFAPGERERVEAALNAAIHEGKPYNIDHRILLAHGVERIMHSEGELVRDAEGRPVSLFGVVHDITDRLRAEKALEESEEKYRGIVETANEGIWVMDADARTVFVNQRMADMLGYAVEEMARKTLFEFIYPEEAGVAEINWDQVKGGGTMRLDFRFRRKDGQPLWTIFSAAPLRNKAGSPKGYLGMLMDITERKLAEAKLIESEADLKWAQRIGNIGSWEWDIKRDVEWWSDEAYRIMGMAPGSVKPDFSILIDHVHPDDRIVVKRAMRDALGKKAPFQADYRVVRDGTERHIHSEGEVIFNDKGVPALMRGIIHDITERKQVEATLAQLASIVVSSNDAIITKTLDGFITGWNAAAERIFGYPAEETIGQPIGIVVPREREREPYEFLDQIRRGERIVNYETVRVTRDGRTIDVSVTISPITDPSGKITGASTICRDITEHKRLEDQLRVSDKRFKVLVNSSTIGIVIANMDSIVEANDTYLTMTGYTREDLQQGLVSWRKMTPPEYEHLDNRGLIELLEHGSCASYEKEYYRKDGSRIPVLIGRALLEKEPLTWVSYVLDITGRKRTEEELKRQESEVSTLINNLPDMVMRFDPNLRYTFQSPVVERVSGIPARKFIGRTVAETGQFDQATVASYEAILRHVFETGQAETFEFNATGPPGTQHFLARIVPEYDARGNVASLLDITQDITERKKAEEALMNSMALAELYMDLMAHDINNMNQVGISNLELALEELADPMDRDLLELALESLKSSSKLIGNVRILQRLMQERIDLGSISLDEALAEAKNSCPQELKKGITIRVNGHGGHVLASDLLKEVFANIIGNSIKHTPGDVSIDITVNRVFGADEGYFKVAIEDNGPGIPDEAKKKVFSRLTPGKKAKGRGIGLYIVKLLVEEYRGRVWVEDRVPGDHSKGARFVVMLPAAEK